MLASFLLNLSFIGAGVVIGLALRWMYFRKKRRAHGIETLDKQAERPTYPNYWADAEGGITPLDPESIRRQA